MPPELRPAPLIKLYWREQLVIEEDAVFYEPEYVFKEAA